MRVEGQEAKREGRLFVKLEEVLFVVFIEMGNSSRKMGSDLVQQLLIHMCCSDLNLFTKLRHWILKMLKECVLPYLTLQTDLVYKCGTESEGILRFHVRKPLRFDCNGILFAVEKNSGGSGLEAEIS